MNRFIGFVKRMWENRAVKTIIVTAVGAFGGALYPVVISGAPITTALIHQAIIGAIAAVGGLYIHKPAVPVNEQPVAPVVHD